MHHVISVVQDTLVESGYSHDEAEEIIARVLSVVDSTEHFISQTTNILEDVSYVYQQSLVCVNVLFLYSLCLLKKGVQCCHCFV